MNKQKRLIRRPVNKKGRNRYSRFVLYYHHELDCPAYRDLKAIPRAVYMELRRRFNGTNNGYIFCSVRDLSAELHCSKDTAGKALWTLAKHGFIICNQLGSFNWKSGQASTWTLTVEPLNDKPATKDFLRWQPPEKKPVLK